ncbi:ZNF91 protein, partial [Polypterus senegalus]|nr:ZNF91 protein [Polypterus senegalus]
MLSHRAKHVKAAYANNERPYKCDECGKSYQSFGFFLSHQRSHMNAMKSVFNDLAQLKKKSFECLYCGRSYSRVSALEAHQRCHADVKLFKALNPEKQMQTKTEKRFSCDECGKLYSTTAGLNAHRRYHSEIEPKVFISKEKEMFKCLECGRPFSSKAAMKTHERWHSYQKKSFECPICGKRFTRATALQSHQRNHSSWELYGFAEEDLENSSEEELHAKKLVCDVRRNHCNCNKCGKCYNSVEAFSQHQKSHSSDGISETHENHSKITQVDLDTNNMVLGDKPYPCRVCGKAYWTFGALYRHKRCHVKQRPLAFFNYFKWRIFKANMCPCPHCGKSFSLPAVRECHIQLHKNESNGKPLNSKKLYSCTVCGKTYTFYKCFKTHELLFHKSLKSTELCHQTPVLERSYECSKCGKNFRHASSLSSHMLSHLEANLENLYQCPDCKKMFNSRMAVRSHRQWHKRSAKLLVDCKQPVSLSESSSFHNTIGPLISPSALATNTVSHVSSEGKVQSSEQLPSIVKLKQPVNQDNTTQPFKSFTIKIPFSHYLFKESVLKDCSKFDKDLSEPVSRCLDCGNCVGECSEFCSHGPMNQKRELNESTIADVHRNMEKTAVDSGPYKCIVCGEGFFFVYALQKHELLHKEAVLKLPNHEAISSKEVVSSSFQNEPAQGSSLRKLYHCPDCEKTYSSRGALYNHRKTHGNVGSVKLLGKQAETVGKDSSSSQNQSESLNKSSCFRNGNCSETPSMLYMCLTCKASFRSPLDLNNHIKLHFGEKGDTDEKLKPDEVMHPKQCPIKCYKCGMSFTSLHKLKLHRSQARSKPYCCLICCRAYNSESSLQRHIPRHSLKRPHVCKYCNMRFRVPAELSYHVNTHTGEKPFSCMLCSMTFSHRGNLYLTRHMLIHTGERPFKCKSCFRTFKQKNKLKYHEYTCSKPNTSVCEKEVKVNQFSSPLPPPTDTTVFCCTECKQTFTTEPSLHQHYIRHARGDL